MMVGQQPTTTRKQRESALGKDLGVSAQGVTVRQPWLDALRGSAVVWMTVFHFSFDLNYFGWIQQDFYRDPVWTVQRTCILSLFLFCAGLGQAMAIANGQTWRLFWQRWLQVAGCAALVSLGSWFMFPNSWIYFGVLHGMAAMLLVTRLTAAWAAWLWPVGAFTLLLWWIAPFLHSEYGFMAVFNTKLLSWVGLASSKPITEDYVPVFPWMAVMWWGYAAGQALARRNNRAVPSLWQPAHASLAGLIWLGRNSLSWYMLHQPVMLGALMAVGKL